MVVESIGADNQPIGPGATVKCANVSDDEILTLTQYLLTMLARKGTPVAPILLNMIKDIYEEVNSDNESGDN